MKTSKKERIDKKLRICIVGCGKGGTALLKLFQDDPLVDIVGVSDINNSSRGLDLAKKLGIPVAEYFGELLDNQDIDIIINVTGIPEISQEISNIKSPNTELIGGDSARFMWQLVEERRTLFAERERILKEHESLYHLGMLIDSIDSVKDAGMAMVEYATKLTSTPAGSLATFDERIEDMALVASKGFSKEFSQVKRWDIRQGGLTSLILNQKSPLAIPDLTQHPNLNPCLAKEGVRAVLAAPLIAEGRIIGILYVNDFKKRDFGLEEISLFSLLIIYAATTLERVKSLEAMRVLSITDGLTGLYNHRYLMEQMQKEVKRALRYGRTLSIIMLDVDHFKQYNDDFGHLEGNKVLKWISKTLMQSARATDTVGRFGGEEFCIVVPEMEKDGAISFAKRILKDVASYEGLHRKVTFSGGVSTFPADGRIPSDLIKEADMNLYEAKRLGRNRIFP